MYLTYASPLLKESDEDILANSLEIMNEICVLIQAYLSITILYSWDADQSYAENELLTAVIRIQLIVNFGFIIRSTAIAIKDDWKNKLIKNHGMPLKDIRKKRKGAYDKLTDEDVEKLRER